MHHVITHARSLGVSVYPMVESLYLSPTIPISPCLSTLVAISSSASPSPHMMVMGSLAPPPQHRVMSGHRQTPHSLLLIQDQCITNYAFNFKHILPHALLAQPSLLEVQRLQLHDEAHDGDDKCVVMNWVVVIETPEVTYVSIVLLFFVSSIYENFSTLI